MKWFKEINDLNELRKMYKKLVIKYHPDNYSESEDVIKEINNEYDILFKKMKHDFEHKDITVEVIGVWIWVSNCYKYKKELKKLGFRWASQKQMWYKHFDDFHKFSSRPASMSYIRAKYGSVEVKFNREKQEEREKLIKA